MIENKECSFIVNGFCVRTIFFTEQSFYAISANWCVLTKIQLQNPTIIAYFDFCCSLSIVIVMTISYIFSPDLKDSLMIIYLWKVNPKISQALSELLISS